MAMVWTPEECRRDPGGASREIERLRERVGEPPTRPKQVRVYKPKRGPNDPTPSVARILAVLRAAGVDIAGPDHLWVLGHENPPNGWRWRLAWTGDPPRPLNTEVGSRSSAANCGVPGTDVRVQTNGIHMVPAESLR